jgi:sialic acid synthase SpsE
MGFGAAVAAVALRGSVIEKNFTLPRADGGVDSAFSMQPLELSSLFDETERAWQSLGQVSYGPTEAEQKSLVFRRSIYVAQDIVEGEIFTKDNLVIVRPGGGVPPCEFKYLPGKASSRKSK